MYAFQHEVIVIIWIEWILNDGSLFSFDLTWCCRLDAVKARERLREKVKCPKWLPVHLLNLCNGSGIFAMLVAANLKFSFATQNIRNEWFILTNGHKSIWIATFSKFKIPKWKNHYIWTVNVCGLWIRRNSKIPWNWFVCRVHNSRIEMISSKLKWRMSLHKFCQPLCCTLWLFGSNIIYR